MKHIATLDMEAINIAHVCSKDDSRPILTAVCIEGGQARAVNSSMLAQCSAETKEPVLIPAQSLLSLRSKRVKVYKLGKGSGLLLIGDKGHSVVTKPIKGSFPNIENFYPQNEPKATVTLSTNLLQQLVKSIPKNSEVRFAVREQHGPVEFIAGEITGLIMPMYTDWSGVKWHYQTK